MLSGRGLCDELMTRPEESYRLCCVVVCDLETSRMGAPYIYDISHLRVKRQPTDETELVPPPTYTHGQFMSIGQIEPTVWLDTSSISSM